MEAQTVMLMELQMDMEEMESQMVYPMELSMEPLSMVTQCDRFFTKMMKMK